MKISLIIRHSLFLLCTLTAFRGIGQDTTALRFANLITGDRIAQHLYILASDSLEGRETARPGMDKATAYVANYFKEIGLPPLANGTYFQMVPFFQVIPGWLSIDRSNKQYNTLQDFYSTQAVGSLDINAGAIVFAGYGIQDPENHWNDLAGLDIRDKVVMLLQGEPLDKKGKMLAGPEDLSLENRIQALRKLNPKAILVIRKDFSARKERVSKWMESGPIGLADTAEAEAPLIVISPEMANDFLRLGGYTTESYEHKVSSQKKPLTMTLKDSLRVTGKQPRVYCHNVLGYVEGTDLKDEVLIITAHLDHLGIRNNEIYHGADDDGSGSSSVLAMANAMATAKREGHGPRRSVLFMTFTGEEKGLLGSKYYTEHPVFPLEKTIADLNIDMIGRVDTINGPAPDYVYLIGADRISDTLQHVTERMNDNSTRLRIDYRFNDPNERQHLYSRSDHFNFIRRGIPANFYFTGLHPDYHKPTDTVDKIDFDKTARIARLVFLTAWELANSPVRPDVKTTGGSE